MRKVLVGAISLATLLSPVPAYSYHENPQCDDGYNDCSSQEYRHDYSNHDRNRNRDRERGAFSPGPFDRSPIEFSNNTICMPGATCYSHEPGEKKESDKDRGTPQGNGIEGRRQTKGIACLIPFPYHCDPKP